ncbi:hypothetical protein [Microbacterium sp. SA39]|uniref:hypothetical protein n=1 Tax=Microbacterium sp. SA39 TaxID=1263625 RepID=UPI0005FA1CB4|nr:hypothetical protein [Microbacterium sp. SA39]KJQ54658.1 hypothetical protein RS85_01387 [Microbacterium sp. SA39]
MTSTTRYVQALRVANLLSAAAPAPLAPLALGAFAELADLTTVEQMSLWAYRHSIRTRRRERHILTVLAAFTAAAITDGPSRFHSLQLRPDATAIDTMCGQLITTAANGDADTVDALTHVWAANPHHIRQAVLLQLLATAQHRAN